MVERFANGHALKLETVAKRIAIVGLSKGIGGAAKATWRMFEGLRQKEDDLLYCFYCSEGAREDPSLEVLPWKGGLWIANAIGGSALTRKILDIRLMIWNRIVVRKRSRHQFFYTDRLVSGRALEGRNSVIHYVWIQLIGASFVAPMRPYIVTLHDMWQLTGGCAYSFGCGELEKGCRYCPEVRRYARRRIKQIKNRKLIFLNGAFRVVVTSEWMRGEAEKAGVLPERIVRIENYIPDVFQYHNEIRLKRENGLADSYRGNTRRLYFVGSIRDARKGFNNLIEALEQYRELDIRYWELSVLGCEDEELEEIRRKGINARGYGILEDDLSQVLMYNQANILVCPSREDNSPNVVAEALCCGLPVVVIGNTGAAEMVEERVNGWIARNDTIDELGKAISRALLQYDKVDRTTISLQARERFGKESTIDKYSNLYLEAVLEND